MNANAKVVLSIAYGMVASLVLGLFGMLILNALRISIDDSIKQIVSGLLGAVGGFLVRSTITDSNDPQPVTVVNPPSDPVPTDDVVAGKRKP